MGLSTSHSRFAEYLRRNGFRATLGRAAVAAKRGLFSSRQVLFFCDLASLGPRAVELPTSITVQRNLCQADLSQPDREQIIRLWIEAGAADP